MQIYPDDGGHDEEQARALVPAGPDQAELAASTDMAISTDAGAPTSSLAASSLGPLPPCKVTTLHYMLFILNSECGQCSFCLLGRRM